MNNKAQFTPGPWTPERDRAKSLSLYSGSTFICEVYHEVDEPSTQQQANVRLIAAAPAMYEALKEWCDYYAAYNPIRDKRIEPFIQLTRKALAQAEGR